MLALLTPYLNIIKISIGVFLVIVAGVFYYNWKESIKREAILEFANKQQEEILKTKLQEVEFFKKQIEVLNKLQIEKEKKISDLQKDLDIAEELVYTNNKDDDAAKILKDAIDEISKLRNKK